MTTARVPQCANLQLWMPMKRPAVKAWAMSSVPWAVSPSYLCIEAVSEAVSPGVAPATTGLPSCELPGNLPAAQLSAVRAYVTQAGIVCEPTHMRSLGQTEQISYLSWPAWRAAADIPYPLHAGQAVRSANCLSLTPGGSGVSCQLTDVTAQRAVSEVQMRQARPACQISASRYMVSSLHGVQLLRVSLRRRHRVRIAEAEGDRRGGRDPLRVPLRSSPNLAGVSWAKPIRSPSRCPLGKLGLLWLM